MTKESPRAPSIAFHILREQGVIWAAGTVTDNRPHKHHALQLTWSEPGSRATLLTDDTTIKGECVVVDGGVVHTLHLNAGLICLIDSESALAQQVREEFLGGSTCAVIEDWIWNGELTHAEALLFDRLDSSEDAMVEDRVRDVLDWLDSMEKTNRWGEVSLEAALQQVNLSESRFLHLFSEEVGTPWRTYLVWRRVIVAMTMAAAGSTLTEAAHAAGYSDSAHLSRQFVSLFGVTPASLVKNSQFVQSG